MKSFSVLLAIAGLVLGLAGMASAHLPVGETFFAVQFPDFAIPQIDGDPRDWAMIPDAYVQTEEQLTETVVGKGVKFDASNLAIRNIVGWNPSTNKLYFFEDRFDNKWYPVGDFLGDTWEVIIDADHSGGQYTVFEGLTDEEQKRQHGRQAQDYQYKLFDPQLPPNWSWAGSQWHIVPPFGDLGFSVNGVKGGDTAFIGQEVKMYTERYFTPWDAWDVDGPANSKEHILKEGDIVGCGWSVIDEDQLGTGGYDGYWTLGGDTSMYYLAQSISDFLLTPLDPSIAWSQVTSVEAQSWGRIKATFTQK